MSTIDIAKAPALPDRGYRCQVRARLIKYRATSGCGGTELAKQCLRQLSKLPSEREPQWSEPKKLARIIDYWCLEDGDIKDPRAFYLIEEFLRMVASTHGDGKTLREAVLSRGRSIAEFLGNPSHAHSAFGSLASGIEPPSRPTKSTVFITTQHGAFQVGPAPTSYLILHDVGEPDFYLMQTMICEWRNTRSQPIVLGGHVGYLFQRSDPPRAVLRDALTAENFILTCFVLPQHDARRAGPSALLDYAWSLRSADDAFQQQGVPHTEIWSTSEWSEYQTVVAEISGHRIWDMGIQKDEKRMHIHLNSAAMCVDESDRNRVGRSMAEVPHLRPLYSKLGGARHIQDFIGEQFGSLRPNPHPIHLAAHRGDLESVRRLLDGNPLLRDLADEFDRLPVDLAYASGNPDLIRLIEPTSYITYGDPRMAERYAG